MGAEDYGYSLPKPKIAGFSFGNTENYQILTWDNNFGMTAFMPPVNEAFNPLPTRALYSWKLAQIEA